MMFRPRNNLFKYHLTESLTTFADKYSQHPSTMPNIGNDVWIGADVTISANINIATGAMIAAGSVVTKDVEPYMIVGGNPATPIKRRFGDQVANDLLISRWWDFEPTQIFKSNPSDPKAIIRRIRDEQLTQYKPNILRLRPNVTSPIDQESNKTAQT